MTEENRRKKDRTCIDKRIPGRTRGVTPTPLRRTRRDRPCYRGGVSPPDV